MSNLENNNEFNTLSLYWRHNGCDSVSNHQPDDCLLDCLFRRRSKKTSKLRVTGLCVGNWPGTGEFPAQMASNAENVSIWWRHHVIGIRIGKFDFIHPRGVDILPSITLETIKELFFVILYFKCIHSNLVILWASLTHYPSNYPFIINYFAWHLFKDIIKMNRTESRGSLWVLDSILPQHLMVRGPSH